MIHWDDTGLLPRLQPARCELHGFNIVNRFPENCPFGEPDWMVALTEMRDEAWSNLRQDSIPFQVYEVCERCEVRAHRIVQRLREKIIERHRVYLCSTNIDNENRTRPERPAQPKSAPIRRKTRRGTYVG